MSINSRELSEKLRVAINCNDVEKVKELVEQGKVIITNVECISVVRANRVEILKYFLRKLYNPTSTISYALKEAVRLEKYDIIKIIIDYFKENKEQYVVSQILDSIIVDAVGEVARGREKGCFSGDKAVKMIKYITDCYCD